MIDSQEVYIFMAYYNRRLWIQFGKPFKGTSTTLLNTTSIKMLSTIHINITLVTAIELSIST
mgnify:CR=1 FL=1